MFVLRPFHAGFLFQEIPHSQPQNAETSPKQVQFTLETILAPLPGAPSKNRKENRDHIHTIHKHQEASYIHRLSDDVRQRSALAPGSPDGRLQLLYLLERESLGEFRNATVHALFAIALTEAPGGYRLYWAVYVHRVSRFTPLYMALIDPFRRFIVYPAVLRRIRRAWEERYPRPLDPRASAA